MAFGNAGLVRWSVTRAEMSRQAGGVFLREEFTC